jgi:hypothetical protein
LLLAKKSRSLVFFEESGTLCEHSSSREIEKEEQRIDQTVHSGVPELMAITFQKKWTGE